MWLIIHYSQAPTKCISSGSRLPLLVSIGITSNSLHRIKYTRPDFTFVIDATKAGSPTHGMLQLSASLHMDQRLFALGRSHASKAVGRPSLWWGLSALSLTEMPPFLENGSQSSRINPH